MDHARSSQRAAARESAEASIGGFDMMGGYAYGAGGLMMLLFWVFVIAVVVWLVLTVTR